MIRVVKEPEERREELMDVAEKLIKKKGFEKTNVSDIVKKAKVAQGTFYYYFESKDDVLNAIINRFAVEMEEYLKIIVDDPSKGAIEKMLTLFEAGKKLREKRKGLTDYLHEERNELLHYRIEKKKTPMVARYFSEIIQQGVKEGVFTTEYPKEAALAILAASSEIGHGAIREGASKVEMARLLVVSLDLMERILGAKPGTFMEITKSMEVKK
ncbi:MAG: TetR/AcrR family transcriptional regulator [Thermoplasmata archaeon]|nr:MAG: TetR/AcrR family transcriptional regulator [Thermoplasmata archaeon]